MDIRVATWSELQEAVFADSWRDDISRFRSGFVFRGVPHETHRLETSLQTGGFVPHERHLLTSFRKYALRNAVHGDSVWNWLSLAKHHGLPTRLLDWTYSPYVAMHFATAELPRLRRDGAIWCVDYEDERVAAETAAQAARRRRRQHLHRRDAQSRGARRSRTFDALSRRDFVLFFEPPSLDERIVNQFALFSLLSPPRRCARSLLSDAKATYRRIIIPAALKWEVRDKLDQANITERVLFPGLDGLSQWLNALLYESSVITAGAAAPAPPRGSDPCPESAWPARASAGCSRAGWRG